MNMSHPNFHQTTNPDNSVYVEFCDDLCSKCLASIKKLNKIKLEDLKALINPSQQIMEFSFSIIPTEDFIWLQNFSGIEDLIYLLFSKFSKKEQPTIKKSIIFLATELENSNYFHYPLVNLKLIIQGNWSEQMIEKLRYIGEALTPLFTGKRGYLELLSFEDMLHRLEELIEKPFTPDDFPLVFGNTKWNIYGTENLRNQLQDLALLQLYPIDPKLLFDKNFEIDAFKKIRNANTPEKSI
jgi:hypothetical protein